MAPPAPTPEWQPFEHKHPTTKLVLDLIERLRAAGDNAGANIVEALVERYRRLYRQYESPKGKPTPEELERARLYYEEILAVPSPAATTAAGDEPDADEPTRVEPDFNHIEWAEGCTCITMSYSMRDHGPLIHGHHPKCPRMGRMAESLDQLRARAQLQWEEEWKGPRCNDMNDGPAEAPLRDRKLAHCNRRAGHKGDHWELLPGGAFRVWARAEPA